MSRHLPVLLLAGLLLLATGCGGEDAAPEPPPPPVEATAEDVPAVDPEAPIGRQAVRLYFASPDGDGLVPEGAEIFATASPVDRAKQILSDLISGPTGRNSLASLPRGTRLRQVYVLDSGVAWADFGSELAGALGGGSAREILAVYSIVDSLALNVPEIQRVGILIDGHPVETLNGHLDLRRPLPPNRGLIGAEAVSPADPAPDELRVAQFGTAGAGGGE